MSEDLSPIWDSEIRAYTRLDIDRQLESLNRMMDHNLYRVTHMRDELQLAVDMDRRLRGEEENYDPDVHDGAYTNYDPFYMDEDLEYNDVLFTPRRVMFDDAVFEIPVEDVDRLTVDHDYVFRNYITEDDSDDDSDTVVEEWVDPYWTPGHLRNNIE